MSDLDAPILYPEVTGFDDQLDNGKAHYAQLPAGTPVTLEAGEVAVDVKSSCCGVPMGKAGGTHGSLLRKWMSLGWQYSATIHTAANVKTAMNVMFVLDPMVLKCVPQMKTIAKKGQSVPKVKKLEKT